MNPHEVIITCDKLITALKSASQLISDSAFVVIGTGALGASVDSEDSPMAQFALTQDIDLCLTSDTWNLDRNTLGQGSDFERANGFHIQLLDSHFYSHLPEGWQSRSAKFKIHGKVSMALAPIDVVFCKLIACRVKDIALICQLLEAKVVTPAQIASTYQSFANKHPEFYQDILIALAAVGLKQKESLDGKLQRILKFLEKTKGTERETAFNRCVLGITFSLLSPEKQKSLQKLEHSHHSSNLNPEDFILSIEKALRTSGIRGITS